MRSGYFLILILLSGYNGLSQLSDVDEYKKDISSDTGNVILIFARGTAGKTNLIAKHFNLIDTNITHIGIGYTQGDEWTICHVTTGALKNGSALITEGVTDFFSVPGIRYGAIWSARCSIKRWMNVQKAIRNYSSQVISFDQNFRLDNGPDMLYCSEFCARVLEQALGNDFSVKPLSKILHNPFFIEVLQRKQFNYFPVDFFQVNGLFTKIWERRFE